MIFLELILIFPEVCDMAYIHCHHCNWGQDDFWNFKFTWKFWKFRAFGYNPLSLVIDDARWLLKPRILELDSKLSRLQGFKNPRVFSWRLLLYEWKKHIRRLFTQKWRTWESYQQDPQKKCPACNHFPLCID